MLRQRVILVNLLSVCCITILIAQTRDTRLADAAMKSDRAAVRSLLKQSADVNASQGDGMTALHWAARNGDSEMTQVLLAAGASVKATTRLNGYTPLYLASQAGSESVIGLLLKAGANPNATALQGMTPLMMAAGSGSVKAVNFLLEAGADPNAKETERGQTPLGFAAAFNNSEAIKALLKHGASVNLASRTTSTVTPVVPPYDGQPNGAQRGGSAAPAGARGASGARGQAAAVPGQANARGGAVAANGGQDLNAGADAGSKGGGNPRGGLAPLMYAARQGSLEAAIALLDGGADVNQVSADRTTALLFAAINAHFDIAKLLLDRGADPNIASMDGAAPLYGTVNVQWARKSFYPQPPTRYEKISYLELMAALLDRGADPNARLTKDLWYSEYNFSLESANAIGTSAFWKCAEVGDIDGMRLLISRGADPNITSKDGVTAMLMASGAGTHGNDDVTAPPGRMAAVRYLVEELHADVNAADSGGRDSGMTALHNAAARGDNEMILYLVSRGARINAATRTGVTVADMANGPRQRIQPFAETVALLEMLGAKNSHKCVSC